MAMRKVHKQASIQNDRCCRRRRIQQSQASAARATDKQQIPRAAGAALQQSKVVSKPSPLSKPQVSASPESDRSSDSSGYTSEGDSKEEQQSGGYRQRAGRQSPGTSASSDADDNEDAFDSPADDAGSSPDVSVSPRQVSRQLIEAGSNSQNLGAVSSAALQQLPRDSPHPQKQEAQAPTSATADAPPDSNSDAAQHTERMHVAVRARPIPGSSSPSCWIIDTAAGTIAQNPNAASPKRRQAGLVPSAAVIARSSNDWETSSIRSAADSRIGTPSSRSAVFKFDTVLDDAAQTQETYSRCIRSMVQSALQGVNATVLAYGELLIAFLVHWLIKLCLSL